MGIEGVKILYLLTAAMWLLGGHEPGFTAAIWLIGGVLTQDWVAVIVGIGFAILHLASRDNPPQFRDDPVYVAVERFMQMHYSAARCDKPSTFCAPLHRDRYGPARGRESMGAPDRCRHK